MSPSHSISIEKEQKVEKIKQQEDVLQAALSKTARLSESAITPW